MMDSVLRRNKEDAEDDVLFGDSVSDAVSEDIFASHPELLKELRVDFTYNREEHEYQKLFRLIASPAEDEKLPVVVLKLIDSFILKQVPSILDFFIFSSLQKLLQRTDWLKPLGERIIMRPIDELKRKFIAKFPLASEYSPQQLPRSMTKVPILYYINHENIVTGD